MILYELIDYGTLKLIWWVLLGVLLIGFAATDGFDMGVTALLPFVARTDTERRVAINTVGPVWEGNQVWFILGGGAIFAAWPPLYAVSFSGFYLAMFVVLAALIFRPVAFKYRSKRPDPRWRSTWDWALFAGGFVPALIFGVAVGNVLQGVPFRLTDEMRIVYEGSFFGLLNPFALLCGLLSLAMLVMHGGAWLGLKAAGTVAERGRRYGSYRGARGDRAVCPGRPGAVARGRRLPDHERHRSGHAEQSADQDGRARGRRLVRQLRQSSLDGDRSGARLRRRGGRVRRAAAGARGGDVHRQQARGGRHHLHRRPVDVPVHPAELDRSRSSLTVWDSASSHSTLFNMLVVTLIFLPIVLAYTAWVYRVLWGKVDEAAIRQDDETLY